MVEINLMQKYPQTKRDPKKRAEERTEQDRIIAKRFGREYFDDDRKYGYGGYNYNPRFFTAVVEDFIKYYGLTSESKVLDVGCAKGFMLYDLKKACPGITIKGLDISEYAIQNSKPEVREFLSVGNAKDLSQFQDNEFDLVISINTIHNLPPEECKQALREIQRVGKNAFITVDAWRDDEEKVSMNDWNLTAETVMHVHDWKSFFYEAGYTGDYYWFIPLAKEESKIKKVMLTQPNYSAFGKRVWGMLPYGIALLNACIKKDFHTDLFDPNAENLTDEEIKDYLKKSSPDVVGISTTSTEYTKETSHMVKLVRETLPESIIMVGGILPTVCIEVAMEDKNVDYWFLREGEIRFPKFLQELNKENPDLSVFEGIAYYERGRKIINEFKETDGLVHDLDSLPLPDYENLDILKYGNQTIKYSAQLVPEKYPFATTSTSRGCPFLCTFCAGWTVTGRKVRMRSAENVLKEIDELYKRGIREIIFLDDHFLFDRQRAIDMMNGLIERNYDLTWKCVNVNIANLDREILELMKKSGSYQLTVSIESGNKEVLQNMIKKPFIDLEKAPEILKMAREMGFELISNFVIGYPKETWEQIRDCISYAEKIPVDYVVFHIATPLPKTELMEMCIEEGILNPEARTLGYCQPIVSTNEFTSEQLMMLRTLEWDRINFSSEERKRRVAKMQGLTLDELEEWRKNTRNKLGVGVV